MGEERQTRVATMRSLDEMVALLDGANIVAHALDGTILRWTEGCHQLYGWSAAEAVGRPVHELLESRCAQPYAAVAAALVQDGLWEGELAQQRRDGSAVFVASRCVTVEVDEAPGIVVVATNIDVSDLKEARDDLAARESHLRSILDTVPEAMVVIDDQGCILSFSTAAERLFGYQADELTGANVSVLMPNPHRANHDAYIGRYLRTGERRIIGYGRVVTGLRKDGSIFPMELAIGEAAATGRRIFTGFIRDLTSRHRLEEELRQAQKMEAVGQLTGGVAHDFNNLLTVITGNLEMMERRISDPKLRMLLDEAQGAAADGAKLTGQLLAFGRRQPLNPQLTDVGRLVSSFAGLLRRTLGEAVELRTVTNGGTLLALVDSAQLQNALLNLGLNARDAMPRGGRLTVEISQVRLDTDYVQMYPALRTGDYVLLGVSDSGVGMTPEVVQRAIEPFFTTKGPGAGTGLGLSMVYGFARQSGGHLQLYSEPGKGTTVRLFLPAAPPTAAAQEAAVAEAPPPDLRGSECILLVEDDARVRRVAVARLEDEGYRVVEAADGAQALALLRQHPDIRLLFTDIVMPGGMLGDELAREARLLRPDLKVLFTSGYAEPALAGREIEAGSWLKKPYTARELASRLRELLD